MRVKNAAIAAALVLGLWIENFIYPAALIVRESHDDIVVLEYTITGDLYVVDENDGWRVGEIAVAIMNTNGTEDMEDDEIIMMNPTGLRIAEVYRG